MRTSVCLLLSNDLARKSTVVINWLSHECLARKPCCALSRMLFLSRCSMMEWYRTFHKFTTHRSERLVDSFWVSPFLNRVHVCCLPNLEQFSFVEGEIEDELKDWCYFIRILL